jgi:pimeloyl-ACP methyl ester carboxylesterase
MRWRASDEFSTRYLPGMLSAEAPGAVRDEMAELIRSWHPLGFRLMSRAVAEADTRSFLGAIRVPTLLIWGDADARSPLSVGQDSHRRIPESQLVVLAGAGHVSSLEQPDAFNAAVRGFCGGIDIG